VIFDVDGTLVDSERDGHRVAFNQAFAAWMNSLFPDAGLVFISANDRRIKQLV